MSGPLDVRLIAAVGKSGQIGLKGVLPWHDPADLRWFKQQTEGHVVVMGWSTYQAIPNGLPGRTVYAIDRKMAPVNNPGEWLRQTELADRIVWIAGGSQIYRLFLPFVSKSVITHIDYSGEADVFMPQLWKS